MPEISVIVPARNAAGTLPRTLAALAAQRFRGGFEVIVVDDGSRDETAGVAAAAPLEVNLLRQNAQGPAAARNLGVEQATGSKLAFCDADVYPEPGWLEAGARALERADLVQGKVLPDPTATLGPFDRTIWITFGVGLFETANLFVSRSLFDRVGGFQEWLRPRAGKALAEDMWFGYRALEAGARTSFSAEALAYHAVFPRGWRAYVRERDRLQYFPAMARQMPELRRRFLHRSVFLNPRTARFDLAIGALAVALSSGSVLPLAGALPYLRAARAAAGRASGLGDPPVPLVALADLAADVVGLMAMARGSARYRSLVL